MLLKALTTILLKAATTTPSIVVTALGLGLGKDTSMADTNSQMVTVG